MPINRYSFPLAILTSAAISITAPVCAALALSPSDISQAAKKVTVLIDGQNPGSGVIINRRGDTYTVLTAHHVVGTPDEYDIVTSDNQTYQLNYNTVKQLPGTDLATLEFTGKSTYSTASLGSSQSLIEGTNVYVTGFPMPSEAINLSIYSFTEGRLIANSSKLLAEGYSLVYSNSTQPGMSGGPVFNDQAQLIGIHGRADALLQNGVYFKQNKNLGIAIDTFLSLAKREGLAVNPPSTSSSSSSPSSKSTRPKSTPLNLSTPAPQTPQPQNRAGDFYLSAIDKNLRGDHRGAHRDLDQAIRINPNFAEAYNDRASLKVLEGDRRGAISDLDQAIRLNPDLGLAYAYRGIYRALEGDKRGANTDVEKALQKRPDVGYAARGVVRWLDNRPQDALSDFNVALRNPSESNQTAEVYYGRGVLHWQLGNKAAALVDANESLRIQPKYSYALEMRGLLNLSNGNVAAALQDFQTTLQSNPNLATSYEYRSIARLVNRDFTGAIQDATTLRQLSPNADSYGVMGLAQVQLGNLPRAIQEFELGAQRIPSNRASYTELAQNLRQVPPNNPLFVQTLQQTLQAYLESFTGGFIDEVIQAYRPFQNQ